MENSTYVKFSSIFILPVIGSFVGVTDDTFEGVGVGVGSVLPPTVVIITVLVLAS